MSFRLLIVLSALTFLVPFRSAAADSGQTENIWTRTETSRLPMRRADDGALPARFEVFSLNKPGIEKLLKRAPEEFTDSTRVILDLPTPSGIERFEIEHSLVVEPGLLKKYPELGATYRGRGLDDPTASVRFDLLPGGFHAMVLAASGTVMIDPYTKDDTDIYAVYFKSELPETDKFICHTGEATLGSLLTDRLNDLEDPGPILTPELTSGTQLRTYRLALAADNEYAVAVGGNTIAGTLAAQVLVMNRVNGIYERELAIHMNIVANNDLIVYAGDNMNCAGPCNATNDPYTNTAGDVMLGENQSRLDAVIGSANYDIGHVFSTGGGGIAGLGVPCRSSKANGVTGLSNPVGDAFAVDYVAHEMGHQWGANHTFNSTVSFCGGNRSSGSAYETGSGITIMAYAGICGNQDLARHSIDTFHFNSLESIVNYSQNGPGNTCAVITSTGNPLPTVSVVGGPFNIPKQTPFALTAAGSDANDDNLTYDWQEYDLGTSTISVPNTDQTGGVKPVLRPYLPTISSTRVFPSPGYILNNANIPPSTYDCGRTSGPCLVGELLPQAGRTMIFQVVVRDNHLGGGGFATASTSVTVDGNSGPFAVASPNGGLTIPGGSVQTVTWNVAGTTASPVLASSVKISLSTDGGNTFSIVLAANTQNDGIENVQFPNIAAANARIKIEAVGNIFFDISDSDFALTLTPPFAQVSGRIVAADGTGLKGATVFMTSSAGVRRPAVSNPLGFYSFDNVATNETYLVTVTSKRFRFAPRSMQPYDNLVRVDFIGVE